MPDGIGTEFLVCPETGEKRFSWIVEQVQFGTVQRTEDGHTFEEGEEMGEIVGSDTDENGVFCQSCEEEHDVDDLVPESEYED